MHQFPDELQPRVGFSVQQELADEFLLAEVVKEVLLVLRSRGVSHPHAAIEAYHTACDLVRQRPSSIDRSPLAQVTTALHIFCLAMPSIPGRASSFPSSLAELPTQPVTSESFPAKVDGVLPATHSRTHKRKTREKNNQPIGKDEQENISLYLRQNQLHTMPYLEYLQTPEWQARRKEKLHLADYRCQVCYAQDTRLDVHHRTYKRRGYEKEQDLVVLCERCHTLFHEHMQKDEHKSDEV